MPRASADDAVQKDVERFLHSIIDPIVAIPVAVVDRLARCARARTQQVFGRPLAVVRGVIDLTMGPARPVEAVVTPPNGDVAQVLDDPLRGSAGEAGAPDDLPIDQYESLAASQVVARLPSLTAPELERVRRFEAANRGRRTILGKVEQLLPST